MKKTAVIYWSGTGNTEAMANAVAEGMKEAGAEVTVMTPDQVDVNALSYSAIAFGCPAMGSDSSHLEDKLQLLPGFLEELEGKSGTLQMENYEEGKGKFTFKPDA